MTNKHEQHQWPELTVGQIPFRKIVKPIDTVREYDCKYKYNTGISPLRAYRNHVPHLLVKQYCISTISVAHYRKPRLEDLCWQKGKILTGTCFLVCIQHISFLTLACVRNTVVDTNMLAVMSLSASIWTCNNINWLGYSVNRSFVLILIIWGMA